MWYRSFIIICVFIFSGLSLFSQNEPVAPELNYVTINENNQVQLNISYNSTQMVDSFIIVRYIKDKGASIKTIYNSPQYIGSIPQSNDTIYIDNDIIPDSLTGLARPLERSESYYIQSKINLTGRTSQPSVVHATIYLTINFQECSSQMTLNWTPYVGWDGNLNAYQIFSKKDNEPDQLLAQVDSGKLSYSYKILSSSGTYNYYIKAVHKNGKYTSKSNTQNSFLNVITQPDSLYIQNISTKSNTVIEVKMAIDKTAPAKEYILFRQDTTGGVFKKITSFDNSSSPIFYTDNVPSTQKLYFYKMAVINTCTDTSKYSNISHNIVLTAVISTSDQQLVDLNWNPYDGWHNGIEAYNIQRAFENEAPNLIKIANGNELNYSDNIQQVIDNQINSQSTGGQYCYLIEAVENNISVQDKGTSLSNMACINISKLSRLPNAINPLSAIEKNRVFKPGIIGITDYLLIVYNRWGVKLFESNNLNVGWEGKVNGKIVPQGVYVYYLSYKTSEKKVDTTGTITVAYP